MIRRLANFLHYLTFCIAAAILLSCSAEPPSTEAQTDTGSDADADADADSDSDADTDTDTDADTDTDTESESEEPSIVDTATAGNDTDTAEAFNADANGDGILSIMPMGDSITATGCWRSILGNSLTDEGHTQMDFVGTQVDPNGCPLNDYDRDHEGYSGRRASDVTADMLAGWFASYAPEIVLLHFGTNDIMGGRPIENIMDGYTTILTGLRSANSKVVSLIAQIIPVAPDGCSACPSQTEALNARILQWATENTTETSPLIPVDQWTGFVSSEDTEDGVHPYKESGTLRIATKWHDALVPFFP